MGIVESIFSRRRSRQEEAEPVAVATAPCVPPVTKLMMLMPDASGIATYQQHTFATAVEAENYLDSILRGDVQEGTIMFWGLTWRPPENGDQGAETEPVVLIRDRRRPGLVYTFSFVDIDSAYDFIRHEMRAGLDLAQASIFWAVPAEATADSWGQITVTPSRPPTRASGPGDDATRAAPEPFVAPARDEPNGTPMHIDEMPAVRLPEPVSVGPEAAAELEAVEEPEEAAEPRAADGPARGAVDDADMSKIISILEARGLRAKASPPQRTGEHEAPEDGEGAPDEPSDAGNPGADTTQVDLSDVFGGRRDPKTLTFIEDFRRRREGGNGNGADADHEGLIEAPAEAVSGIAVAWSNIGAAIDEAIDADVARRVSATISWRRLTGAFAVAAEVRMLLAWRRISRALHAAVAARAAHKRGRAEAWRRLTRAFAAAASVRMLVTWRRIARALYAGAAIQAAREHALAEAWRNAARGVHQAAESRSGRRAKRLAWANISWTLEEAVYAARLQRKRAAARAWRNATGALAVAAGKKVVADRTQAEQDRVKADKKTSGKRTTRGSKDVKIGTEETKKAASGRVKGRGKGKDAPKPVTNERSVADVQAAAMELWRSRESGRFSEKKGPFDSFESPPGRF
jgi:hypothetical protein